MSTLVDTGAEPGAGSNESEDREAGSEGTDE